MSDWTGLATARASVLRAPVVGGRRGEPVVHLADLRCTPPQPLAGQEAGALLQRLRWDTPHTASETYVVGHHGIQTGDVLLAGGRRYTVRAAAEWTPPPRNMTPVTHLVLEETKS